MKNFNDFLKKQLENPDVAAEFKRIDPQFQIAKELIKLRIKRGITQKELALRIGSTQAVVSRIESGAVNSSIDTLQKLSEALDAKLMIQIEPNEVVSLLEEFTIEPISYQDQIKAEINYVIEQKGKGTLTTFPVWEYSHWDIKAYSSSVKSKKEKCLS